MTIEPTDEHVEAFKHAWHSTAEGAPGDRTRAGLRAVLNGGTPEAQRDLAAQLLRAASEREVARELGVKI